MKKITAILFLSIYLFAATGVKELFKTNMLIQHFYETQKKDNSVTLFHFLVMHYITDDLNDKDNSRDQQLPFKSNEVCVLNNTLVCITSQYILPLDSPSFAVDEKDFLAEKELFFITNYSILIWHPPRYS